MIKIPIMELTSISFPSKAELWEVIDAANRNETDNITRSERAK